MGNMLESDSSGNSDIEVEEGIKNKPKERTAGDGMESDINLPAVIDAPLSRVADSSGAKLNLAGMPMPVKMEHDKNDNIRKVIGSKNQDIEPNSPNPNITKLDGIPLSLNIAGKSLSPRQMPSRDLLIPVKPPKLDNNNAGASGKSPRLPFDAANVKQKNPKFVPYEPYSAATRPMITSQGHVRKPSDSSSVVSQSSTISTSESHMDATTDQSKFNESNFSATGNILSPHQTQSPSKHGSVKNKGGTTYHQNHHPSTTLMKERLKMAEKEIFDLQSENSRLKKLFVDSMAGVSCPITTGAGVSDSINFNSTVQQNANNLQHRNKECVDNLNDELEVSRSKFLSSCVLVDQLTKHNHDLKDTINEASEIIKDLKNTVSLTQEQYENINEWLRKIHHTSYSSLPDNNFSEDYLDAPSSS